MNRLQLEHLIRAAGDIAGDDEIVILGWANMSPAGKRTLNSIKRFSGWGWFSRIYYRNG